jgi:hypothetical protein
MSIGVFSQYESDTTELAKSSVSFEDLLLPSSTASRHLTPETRHSHPSSRFSLILGSSLHLLIHSVAPRSSDLGGTTVRPRLLTRPFHGPCTPIFLYFSVLYLSIPPFSFSSFPLSVSPLHWSAVPISRHCPPLAPVSLCRRSRPRSQLRSQSQLRPIQPQQAHAYETARSRAATMRETPVI